jgi:hypothetical protein
MGMIMIAAGAVMMVVFATQGYFLGILLAVLPITLGLIWVRVAAERAAQGKPARGTD